jgi:probable rRNA maturation factor
MGLEIIDEHGLTELPEEEMKRLTRVVLENEGFRGKEVALLLTNDATIRNLNRSFRKMDRATDVLAFPMSDDEEILGDIAISIETAQRQAERAGHSLNTEMKYLLLHGLLHLCGMDHYEPKGDQWKKVEEKYLEFVFNSKPVAP